MPVPPDPYTVHDDTTSYSTACVDYDSACSGYGVNGYCDGPAIGVSDDYLMKMCKKSCGFCKTNQDFTSAGIWIKKTGIPKLAKHIKMQKLFASKDSKN
ncbi:hypothetical protein OS493_013863 [Desmophyllum pertusum]|uniref:ShKT domain-containing protein n=1 Tax=Desmophyllum pertusum TaxID=174260 RepID=A0A9X0D4W7_9CNID|nr:hypothetical protein OS493_013863 [Desmophyllum pertusum]